MDLQPSYSPGDLVFSYEPWVWCLSTRTEYGQYCAYCFSERKDLRVCSGCRLHRYCNTNCQATDWKKEHKMECGMLKNVDCADAVTPKIIGSHDVLQGSTSLLLMTKIARKMKMEIRDEIGGVEKKSARDILDAFPARPKTSCNHSLPQVNMLHRADPERLFPGFSPFASKSDFLKYLRIVQHHAFPILNAGFKDRCIGAALIPQAPHQAMTPVCWDSNVVIDFRGRSLVVHATENIPQYNGLSDLRYSELMRNPFFLTLDERQSLFQEMYFRPCSCPKCTLEYDAEISPLKCGTPGCTKRIPSDDRAHKQCPQCGAINANRRCQFKRFMDKFYKIRANSPFLGEWEEITQYAALLEEMDAAGIVHTDAHIRFLIGWDRATYHRIEGRFDAAWKLQRELVCVIRALIPRYHIRRALYLYKASMCPIDYLTAVPVGPLRELPADTQRTVATFLDDYQFWVDCCKESVDIFAKVYGKDSASAKMSRKAYASAKLILAKMRGILID